MVWGLADCGKDAGFAGQCGFGAVERPKSTFVQVPQGTSLFPRSEVCDEEHPVWKNASTSIVAQCEACGSTRSTSHPGDSVRLVPELEGHS